MPYYPPVSASASASALVSDNGISTANSDTANLAAWNALMAVIPDNSEVYFPSSPNPYSFSGTLAIPTGKHLRIRGASNQKSIIQTTSATGDIFTVGDWYNEFVGLKFTSSVTRTAGAAINSGNNVAVCVYNCDFAGMWDGIVYTGGANAGNLAVVSQCNWTGTRNRGLVIDGTNANTIMDTLTMDGTLGVQQVGLEVLQAGSLVVSNCDFIRAVNNVRFNPGLGLGVFSAYFVNTFFDTASASSVKFTNVGNIQRIKFVSCWFSGSVNGCEIAGTGTTLPTAIDFVACDFYGNSQYGLWVTGAQEVSVANCRVAGNTTQGILSTSSTGTVSRFSCTGSTVGPTGGFGANGVGISATAGTGTTYAGLYLVGNDVRGNTTSAIVDSSTVSGADFKVIRDNLGHTLRGLLNSLQNVINVPITTETPFLTLKVPANSLVIGQMFRVKGSAVMAGLNTTPTWRIRMGTTGSTSDTQVHSITAATASTTNQHINYEGTFVVRSTGTAGTLESEGFVISGTSVASNAAAAAATVTVNTTVVNYIGVSFAAGASTTNIQQCSIESL